MLSNNFQRDSESAVHAEQTTQALREEILAGGEIPDSQLVIDPDAGGDAADAFFEKLEREVEEDGVVSTFRERRMEELKAAAQRAQMLRSNRHGTYEDIMDEKELLKLTTSDEQVVVHFYHKEFRRCKIMDKHLSLLAPVHIEARFVKIDVDRCPFIVERLKIQVLPCVIMFVKSIAVDRIIGFEDIPGGDSCQTSYIAQRLANGKVIKLKAPKKNPRQRKTIFGATAYDSDEASE